MSTHAKRERRRRKEDMSVLTTKNRLDPALERELLDKQHLLRDDYLWIDSKLRQLGNQYKGKYIVVQRKKVVYFGKSPFRLLEKICKSGQKVEDFAIQYIGNCPACLLL